MREFFHGWRRKAGCVMLVIVNAVAGCSDSLTSTYSTTYSVTSSYPGPVIVTSWEGMPSLVNPGVGIVYPSQEIDGVTSYPRQDHIPRKVIIVWHVQTDRTKYWREDEPKEVFRQELKLAGVIPKGERGRTVFNIDKKGALRRNLWMREGVTGGKLEEIQEDEMHPGSEFVRQGLPQLSQQTRNTGCGFRQSSIGWRNTSHSSTGMAVSKRFRAFRGW